MPAWLKVRPQIDLHAPTIVLPGAPFAVLVVLRCVEAVPIKGVHLELLGGNLLITEIERTHTFLRAITQLRGAGSLEAGEHAFQAQLTLPPDAPPSYFGARLRVKYALHVHVDIPWWPDARASHQLVVATRAREEPGVPRLYTSPIAAPPGSRPHLEISLHRDTIGGGGDLEGAVAVIHGAGETLRSLHMTLIACERLGPKQGVHYTPSRRWVLSGPEGAADTSRRFHLKLPGVFPGFEHQGYGLSWFLEVEAGFADARDLKVKLPITLTGSAVVDTGERRALPPVGSERQALLWQRIAKLTGLRADRDALVGRLGEVTLRITRERRPGAVDVVVAALAPPSLAIGLSLAAGEATRSFVSRDMSQATWLEGQLSSARGELRWTAASDDELRLEAPEARDAGGLVAFVRAVLAVTHRLEEVHERIPPPRALADRLPRWVEAAALLGARLRPGDLALLGRGEGHEYALLHEWDPRGEVVRTHLVLRPEVAIDERLHLRWRGQGGDAPESSLPLARLCEGAWQLEIERQAIRIVLAGVVDPVAEIGRIHALQALSGRLSGRLGLYR
ncbi:MAG: hypothetical protein R3B09_01900 [Nannocystaceae bacterium]